MVAVEIVGSVLLALLLCALAALLIVLGWQMAVGHFRRDRDHLLLQRQALNAEWKTLENTRRVRGLFLDARRAMQREADVRYRFRRGER